MLVLWDKIDTTKCILVGPLSVGTYDSRFRILNIFSLNEMEKFFEASFVFLTFRTIIRNTFSINKYVFYYEIGAEHGNKKT